MAREPLGEGWAFPVRINETGGISVSRYDDKIGESIRIILGTAKGERAMRPDFGCDLQSFVFTVVDRNILTMIRAAVEDALIRWEPRIDVTSVDVISDPDTQGKLRIEVNYRIRETNTESNLVYPFYLQSGA